MGGGKFKRGAGEREAASRRSGPESYWNSNERPPDPDKKESRRRSGAELPPRRRLSHVAAAGGPTGAGPPAARPHALRGRGRLGGGPGLPRSGRAGGGARKRRARSRR